MSFGMFNSSTTPVQQESNKLVCKISPANFDQLTKILSHLEKSGIITIKDSKITQTINKGIALLFTDIQQIVGTNVNMQILSPEKAIKKFRLIKTNSDVSIFDNSEMQRYEIKAEGLVIKLPKQIQEIEDDNQLPSFEGVESIGSPVIIDKAAYKLINGLMTGNDYVELIIHDNQFKGIYTQEATYILPAYSNDNINETNAQHLLKCYAFLPIDGEEFTVNIGKGSDKFWVSTNVNTGYLNINIFEDVVETSGDNMLI